jgi:putative aminopeptidase FrvX
MEPSRLSFFRQLLDTPSPSGFEAAVQRVWRADVAPHADEIIEDPNGSLVATLRGKAERPSILISGHADEIGIIVNMITEDGLLHFYPIGGIDAATMVNQHVRLMGPKGLVRGVIGRIAAHLTDNDKKGSKAEVHELNIDIGARDRAEAEQYAPIGTPGVIGGDTVELLNKRIAARDVDNKFGCFVVAEVLRRVHARRNELTATLHIASTVQEETGLFGARHVAYRFEPSAMIAIDVSHATDSPGISKAKFGDFPFGKGPMITTGVLASKKLVAALVEAGKKANIPARLEVDHGKHGTDADAGSQVRGGVPVTTVSTGLRYMHSSVEVADLDEIDQVCTLLTEFVLSVKEGDDFGGAGNWG